MPRKPHHMPGHWVPWAFVAFFAVVVAANGILVFVALDTWSGLETERSYEKGLAYNRTLAASRAQEELGWRVELDFAGKGERRGSLTASLRDRYDTAIARAEVEAAFVRPTHAGHDFTIVLPYVGQGRYNAEVVLPLSGRWDVRLRAVHQGHTYRMTRRVHAP